MRVLVTASAHFGLTSDGILWTPNASLGYNLWSRYLEVFDEVHLLVRAKLQSTQPTGWKMASGPGIKVIPVPDFLGPWEFVKNYMSVRRVISEAVKDVDAIQLRIPCIIGSEVRRSLASGRPYGVEVVGDPYDVFAPGAVRHPLRSFFRWSSPRQLRRQCAGACAAAYVTKQALQARYPCSQYSVGISDVDLSEDFLVLNPRRFRQEAGTLNLIFVGTLAQLYKAPDILIDAVASCVQAGIDLKLTMVGDGKHRRELEAQAVALGLGERVCFRGQLSAGKTVTAALDQADLFVLPSYQEGLPRAMVEAMARALPCIGSTVGGIPELLPPEDMMPPGDVGALAKKIREVVTNPERMAQMSARNLEKAKEYRDEILREQRIEFYLYVREKTEAWINQRL